MNAPLNEKLGAVKWGEYKLYNLFDSMSGNYDIKKEHINDKGTLVITSGLANNGILGKSDIAAKIFPGGTITIDMFGNSFFRNSEYKMVTHARVFSLQPKFEISTNQGLFLSSALKHLNIQFGFENICTWEKIRDYQICLPTLINGKIDFSFMESFIEDVEAVRIAELEAESKSRVKAYLAASDLNNYELSSEEKEAVKGYQSLQWNACNLQNLFGKSTRGKRLKSGDRLDGSLPFVTAGEANEGISAYIGNDVEVFEKNTTTIDMFGSAKYRNYQYGADDHVAVVHTESLPVNASIFITAAIHKASHTGKFDYGHNFYAKDADALDIMLPTRDGKPDYRTMELLISAVHKLVIQDVVRYANQKIQAAKNIIQRYKDTQK